MARVLLVGALTAAALLAGYGAIPRPLGVPFVLAFLLMAPGLAWIDPFDQLDPAEQCIVSVGLSLALDTIVGCFLAFGLWSPLGGLGALVAATAAGLACSRRRDDGG
jgi:hypothetical protein